MDRKPVEPPDSVGVALRQAAVVVLGHEKSVLAVLAEGAEGVLEHLAAFSAFDGIMAHDLSPNKNNNHATKTRRH
jgi:hypothetical protein